MSGVRIYRCKIPVWKTVVVDNRKPYAHTGILVKDGL